MSQSRRNFEFERMKRLYLQQVALNLLIQLLVVMALLIPYCTVGPIQTRTFPDHIPRDACIKDPSPHHRLSARPTCSMSSSSVLESTLKLKPKPKP